MGNCRKFIGFTDFIFTALISSFDLATWQKKIEWRDESKELTGGGESHADEGGSVLLWHTTTVLSNQ